jgi:hypothetical protein
VIVYIRWLVLSFASLTILEKVLGGVVIWQCQIMHTAVAKLLCCVVDIKDSFYVVTWAYYCRKGLNYPFLCTVPCKTCKRLIGCRGVDKGKKCTYKSL